MSRPSAAFALLVLIAAFSCDALLLAQAEPGRNPGPSIPAPVPAQVAPASSPDPSTVPQIAVPPAPAPNGENAEIPLALPVKSDIYFAQSPFALENWEENPEVTRRMVDRVVLAATGKADIAAAWRSLVSPTDRVGIKVATLGGHYHSSHLGIVSAIVRGLEAAGVSRTHVIVWDRNESDLAVAGFSARRDGYTVSGIVPGFGYDPQAPVSAPALGVLVWGDWQFMEKHRHRVMQLPEAEQVSSTSYWSRILTQEVTKIVNVPVFSDESGCGVAGAVYNVTVPNLDNWRRFTQVDGSGANCLADLYADERVAPKVVLHIMDGLLAQYAGGPRFNANYIHPLHAIYASKDPIALDAHALRLMDGWRQQVKLPPLSGVRSEWLQAAQDSFLGNAAADRITVHNVTP